MACQILGFSSSELVQLRLDDLITNMRGIEALAEIEMADPGKILVSGKVVKFGLN